MEAEEKRLRALSSVTRADDAHRREKANIWRRFYEPSSDVIEQREAEWQRRRAERKQRLDKMIRTVKVQRTANSMVCVALESKREL